MTTAERRAEILDILKSSDSPVPARELAARFGVSRQVIVQDMAVIRASTSASCPPPGATSPAGQHRQLLPGV